MNESELKFYNRQIILSKIGIEGQTKLVNSRVLVIGAGGLGSSALQYLAASGIGNIGICDYDTLDISNLHRQVIYNFNQLGLPKVEAAKNNIGNFNPNTNFEIINQKVTATNIEKIISDYDVVLDCTDNFKTKFLIHDACYLHNKNLVQSSIYQFEGQLHVFRFADKNKSGCFRCLWPIIPEEGCVGTCGDIGVLGVVPGIFGTLQATETIKLLLGWEGLKQGQTFIFDMLSLTGRIISWKKNQTCPLCGEEAIITDIATETYENLEQYEVYSDNIKAANFIFVDVREKHEINESFPGDFKIMHIPFSSIQKSIPKIAQDKSYLFFCNRGIKSKRFVKIMRKAGLKNTFSLKDGMAGIKKLLDGFS